jgi:hypothetical protein
MSTSTEQAIHFGDPLVSQLVSATARARVDRFSRLLFPETLPESAWCTAPELVGLWGTRLWDELEPGIQRAVSFWEAVNFFSLNIHGERTLMNGLASRLYQRQTTTVTPYLHCFLDEENRHSQAFGTFCLRYAGRIYPSRQVTLGPAGNPKGSPPGLEDLLFFARVTLFEEIVDYHNRRMQHDLRLAPIVRSINRMHHRDESRHLRFGRRLIAWLWETYADQWTDSVKERARHHLHHFIRAAWRDYYNPLVYRDAGLPNATGVAEAAWSHPAQTERRVLASEGVMRYLTDVGVFAGSGLKESTP